MSGLAGSLRRRIMVLGLAPLLLVASCAYFNELYNAKQAFSEAQRAEARGDRSGASQRYSIAVEKAAKSVRRSPDGRWADDALFLIGRSHFALGDYAKARAALLRALEVSADRGVRAKSLAYLGAVELRLNRPADALARLEQALAADVRTSESEPVARLWRGRTRFVLGEPEAAWQDIEIAARADGPIAREALLEQLERAIRLDEPTRAGEAVQGLARLEDARLHADSIRVLGAAAAERWGAGPARALLAPLAGAPWPAATRDSMTLFRASIAVEAGDTAAAVEDLREVLSTSTGAVTERARVLLARWELARVQDVDELETVRSLLLPALAQAEARELVQGMKTLDVLLERARTARQPLALFAAGELARDRLGATTLARRLFTAHVDMAPQTSYAGKALLAAKALNPPPAEADGLEARAAAMADNFYLQALSGSIAPGEFQTVEERLDRVLATMVTAAEREAERRDALVVQTIAELDSLSEAAALDTVATRCGLMMDSLGIAGVRGDSARAACVRSDTLRLDSIVQGLLRLPGDSSRRREDQPRDTTGSDTFLVLVGQRSPSADHLVWSLLSPVR